MSTLFGHTIVAMSRAVARAVVKIAEIFGDFLDSVFALARVFKHCKVCLEMRKNTIFFGFCCKFHTMTTIVKVI